MGEYLAQETLSVPPEKVEIVPAVVPLWAVNLTEKIAAQSERIAKLEVKMNIIAGLAIIATSAAVVEAVKAIMH